LRNDGEGEPEEHKVIHPFDHRLDLVKPQNIKGCVCHTTLDTACGSKTFNRHMFDINTSLPEDAKVFFMSRENGRISVSFCDVE